MIKHVYDLHGTDLVVSPDIIPYHDIWHIYVINGGHSTASNNASAQRWVDYIPDSSRKP